MSLAKVIYFTFWLFMPREHTIMGQMMTRGWVPVQQQMALTECSSMAFVINEQFGKYEIKALCTMDADKPNGPMSRVIR